MQRQVIEQVEADERLAAATLGSAEATEVSARLALEDTGVWTAIAGVVANRRSRVGEYVTAGTRMLSVVPTEGLWIEANFRETQLARMRPDQPVAIRLDTYPGRVLCGYVESIGVASGTEFSLFPPDNVTGNFTKIVRRFPVRIRVNATDPGVALPGAGMSAEVRVGVAATSAVAMMQRAIDSRRAYLACLTIQVSGFLRHLDAVADGHARHGDRDSRGEQKRLRSCTVGGGGAPRGPRSVFKDPAVSDLYFRLSSNFVAECGKEFWMPTPTAAASCGRAGGPVSGDDANPVALPPPSRSGGVGSRRTALREVRDHRDRSAR